MEWSVAIDFATDQAAEPNFGVHGFTATHGDRYVLPLPAEHD